MTDDNFKFTRTFQKLVAGKNISEVTLLATDYLNHFNEIVMLLEMIPDMPDCLEDAKEWKPKTYSEHFRDSAFSDKELAIEAYEHSPAEYKIPFDRTTNEINAMVAEGITAIEAVLNTNDSGFIRETVTTTTQEIQKRMDRSNAIIHGQYKESVDDQTASTPTPSTEVPSDTQAAVEESSETMSQEEIDMLLAM